MGKAREMNRFLLPGVLFSFPLLLSAAVFPVDEIDFQALVSNEKVHSVAEVILVNAEKVASGVVQEGLSEIAYKALPAALVDKVKVDVGNMKVGDTIRVKDLEIAKDKEIDLSTDPEAVVATVTAVHNVVPETETEETAEE